MDLYTKNNYIIKSAYGVFYETNSPDDFQPELCSYDLENIIWNDFETLTDALKECYIITGGNVLNEFQKYISYSKSDNKFYVEILLDEDANHITEKDKLHKEWKQGRKLLNLSVGFFQIFKEDNTIINFFDKVYLLLCSRKLF